MLLKFSNNKLKSRADKIFFIYFISYSIYLVF